MASSLAEFAYQQLLDKLLNNELVPGQLLNRREVAQELRVSVAPVLEAMLQLEHEGFLESIARKGTQVRPIRSDDVVGMLVVREAIECQAARLYCGKPLHDAMDRLRLLADELDSTDRTEHAHWQKELEFHGELVKLSDVDMLREIFRRSINLAVFYGVNKLLDTDNRHEQQSHADLLQELLTTDADEAESVMRVHVRSGKGALMSEVK